MIGILILAQLDILDDILLPKDGLIIKGKYENSQIDLGSSLNYQFYQTSAKIYKTFHLNTYGISGYYHRGTKDTPPYMTTIFEGSQTFSGTKEFELHGSSITFFKIDYRYKHDRDIYFHLMIDWLMNAQSETGDLVAENILGFGTGITLISPLGPLEFIWSIGPKNIYTNTKKQNHFHFSAGYKF